MKSDQSKLSRVENGLRSIVDFIDTAESIIINIVAKLSPWAAPLPTAYLVYDRTRLHLDWPDTIALVAAIAIEALGLATTSTTLQLYRYNKTRKKVPPDFVGRELKGGRRAKYRGRVDPPAPTTIPAILTVIYVVVAEGLTVVLDIATKWGNIQAADIAPAIFPLLSITGMALLAVQADHTQRLADITAATTKKPKSTTTKPSKPVIPNWAIPYQCWCGWWPGVDEGLSERPDNVAPRVGGHSRKHRREVEGMSLEEANLKLRELYPGATEYPNALEVTKWITTK